MAYRLSIKQFLGAGMAMALVEAGAPPGETMSMLGDSEMAPQHHRTRSLFSSKIRLDSNKIAPSGREERRKEGRKEGSVARTHFV